MSKILIPDNKPADQLEYFVIGQILEVKAANGAIKRVRISAVKINNKVAARGVFTLGEGAQINLPIVDKVEAAARRVSLPDIQTAACWTTSDFDCRLPVYLEVLLVHMAYLRTTKQWAD